MIAYLLRRSAQTLATLFVLSLLVFVGVFHVGNPVDVLISATATAQEREEIIRAFGLDLPMWQQYWAFLVHALHGDLGRSFVFN